MRYSDNMPEAEREDSELVKASPDGEAMQQFISPLISMEHQVGRHVIHALQQRQHVAVLTTVMPGPGGHEAIVSVGLDAQRLQRVQELLDEAPEAEVARVPCIGFHCFVDRKDKADEP